MGFLDKMADAFDPLTGGGAVVDIAYPRQPVKAGEWIGIKVFITSTGGEIKSNGVYVDVIASEQGRVSGWGRCPNCHDQIYTDVDVNNTLVNVSNSLCGPFVLPAQGTQEFEAQIQIPQGPSTHMGRYLSHRWHLRGRLDAFGNDPDSGLKEIVVE